MRRPSDPRKAAWQPSEDRSHDTSTVTSTPQNGTSTGPSKVKTTYQDHAELCFGSSIGTGYSNDSGALVIPSSLLIFSPFLVQDISSIQVVMKLTCALLLLVVTTLRSSEAFQNPPSEHSLPSVRRYRSVLWGSPGADIEQPAAESLPREPGADVVPYRGKVNEIDFCIAPADVSLSRSYLQTKSTNPETRILSLTRALNNASNRAVRRILLARSWPSAEALNLSLRQILKADSNKSAEAEILSASKCPVPRPILNILMRRRADTTEDGNVGFPIPRSRTDQEYVNDQIAAFRESYGAIPGYSMAEIYLECILSLATSGFESPRVKEVMEAGVYDESYTRVLAVLKSVGTVVEDIDGGRTRIADKLVDQDICLSMLDKLNSKPGKTGADMVIQKVAIDQVPVVNLTPSIDGDTSSTVKFDGFIRLKFWRKAKEANVIDEIDEVQLSREDLGGVLLSAEEPSMTRQLNALSNIVQRALLFGGDQELLVLAETLDADKVAFLQRWYPGSDEVTVELTRPEDELRPGAQYLNCLVKLLRVCYDEGGMDDLLPPLPLIKSYANAYDRLTGSLVELGSGYVKPVPNVKGMPLPRTAQEELGRFAVWESTFRKQTPDISSYPEDMEGSWEVQDEIGGETIGMSTVIFNSQGQVEVAPPMQGLRWRLDPGPTHLDTCTFQVLSDDGSILQYRGFIDRGARLEARFSKRSVRIRGSVMFQMRDGDTSLLGQDYWKDMLPINYRAGTTKFVMTKTVKDKTK